MPYFWLFSHSLIVERHRDKEIFVGHGLKYRINTTKILLTNFTDGHSDVTVIFMTSNIPWFTVHPKP